jgi:TPP-dependent pyruvate/acetoin dehydrogenase alpha subunit
MVTTGQKTPKKKSLKKNSRTGSSDNILMTHPGIGKSGKDKSVSKKPDKKLMIRMLKYMMQQRSTEERIFQLYKEGKIVGGAFSAKGMEAIPVGGALALGDKDVLFPTFRDLGAYFVRGMSLRQVFCQHLGRRNGPTRGRDANMHMGDPKLRIFGMISHLGAMIPVAAGTALAGRLKGEKNCALAYIGDGGTSSGDFHEGLNLASVLKLPLVVIIANNQIAYSTPNDKQYACKNLVDKAAGYGIKGHLINGNDVLEVFRTTCEAVRSVKAGNGPVLIEAKTFRMHIHNGDNHKNASESVFKAWEKKDPIETFANFLKSKKILSDTALTDIRNTIDSEIEDAVSFAEESPLPDGADARDGVFAQ